MRYGMVIDLSKCSGCMSCDVACKRENFTPARRALEQGAHLRDRALSAQQAVRAAYALHALRGAGL